ncbi:hypothetical protein [Streptomyces sp. A012304]|uniref:hypothetical protein n=1 Tax=Streptomyces sp. A012304 TaxID=375446 RepID=UPI00223006FF|nr:hypothetical protein [Streptomyces sp. A012304]GKQ40491.1 hypothetical protein ALMP_70160 [Streptomyces sp. A012304]
MHAKESGVDARGLFEALRDHGGRNVYDTVVRPWLDRAEDGYRAALERAGGPLADSALAGDDERHGNLLWELYALSRVSDVLLLSFQPAAEATGAEWWAHRLHPPDRWPRVTTGEYLGLFTGLGMTPFEETTAFDPFLHEIVEVEQAEDPDEPVRITEVVWPGLWWGAVLFQRAGVRVRAGARHAERGVADRSPLYWTFLRRHRPTVDESMGWGHNSQWATDFRVDLRTATGDHANACATSDIDDPEEGSHEALLTRAERRDLVRHRCLVRTPAASGALARKDPGWQADLYPYDWRLTFPAGTSGR